VRHADPGRSGRSGRMAPAGPRPRSRRDAARFAVGILRSAARGRRAPLSAREDAHGRRDRRGDDAARADVGSRRAGSADAARRRVAVSFILDALRKSERERRQEIPPSIARITDAVPSRATPTWALATIAVLGACVLALGGAWIYTVVTEPAGTTAPGADTARVADVGRTVGTTRVEPVSLPPKPPAPTASTGSAPRNGERTSAETAT